MYKHIIYVCCLSFQILKVFGTERPVVKTPLGLVSGVYEKSFDGRVFSAFYGIPYAKPPVGDLRFENPQKIIPWTGTWKAENKETACAQVLHVYDPSGGPYLGDEDCLYLNVFSPDVKSKENLDVIVFIHGGGFMYGAKSGFSPDVLMDRDVVLVIINYRLGVLGFLSTEDKVVPGNNGLKDQVMALQWIHDNINYFGGNPDSVTISGLSAGGASVHFHYLSPLTKGLFHKGISMSGTALGPSKIQENALGKAKIIAAYLGCPETNTKVMINCMKERPTRDVVESIRILRPWLFYPYSPLAAVVEKRGKNSFLIEDPWHLLKIGEFHDLPWLNSITSEEGLYPGAEFYPNDEYIHQLETKWNDLLPHLLDYNYTIPVDQRNFVSQEIRKAYLKDEPLTRDNFLPFINMIGDRMFSISAEESSKMQAEKSKSNIFYYYFSYLGEKIESPTQYELGIKGKIGVAHGDDTEYLLPFPHPEKYYISKNDQKIRNVLLDMWTSFARTDVPTINSIHWLPVSKDKEKPLLQLHIQSPDKIFMENVNVIDRKRGMWKNIPFEENENFGGIKHDEL